MRTAYWRFPATIFVSAFLLFQVQPIMGRYVLPWFGGSPAVWTNCLLFFQVLLLAGYAYAHWVGSLRSSRAQAVIHAALVAASFCFLPIRPRSGLLQAGFGDPSWRILLVLTLTVSGPYFILSSTSPLLQRWFSLGAPDKSPWRLYALSNLGSFLALLTYPFLIEPYLRLNTQAGIWSGLYVLAAAGIVWCGIANRGEMLAQRPAADLALRPTTLLFWLGLATAGSALLVATTNQVSQEIAVNPFLWVAPLAIYLLTFVLAFEREGFYRRSLFGNLAGVAAPVGCALQVTAFALPAGVQVGLYLAVLFIMCMICNGELARARPPTQHLTAYYLAIAAGGALGGAFVALVAPRIFMEFTEYPIGLALACALALVGAGIRKPQKALIIAGITAVVAGVMISDQQSIASKRNFYGILRVTERRDDIGMRRQLRHGRILHGFQYLDPDKRKWPTTYYGPHSGVAHALKALDRPGRRIGLVGLGVGTLAAWGKPGDSFRFYEINPDVESMARRWFTFLQDSAARTEVVLGDARVQLEQELASEQSADFDALVVDAFSSDAIPVHLLTAECAEIYRRRLVPGGVLLLHITNRVLNLDPVVRGMAADLGWHAGVLQSQTDDATGETASRWVILTSDGDFIRRAGFNMSDDAWTPPGAKPIRWTDDYSSLWHVVQLFRFVPR
jgi:hypothetical protein